MTEWTLDSVILRPKKALAELTAPRRQELPQRRASEVTTFLAGNMKFHATIGYYDEEMQRPGEVFLNGGKIGSDLEVMMLQ